MSVLSGKKILVISDIEKEMKSAARRGDLQKAIELRDKLKSVKRVFENAKILNTKYLILDTKTEKENDWPPKQLAKIVGMNRLPHRIEGYDVANIQGKYAVGAMVVFSLQQSSPRPEPGTKAGQTNYKPDRNEYRKFKIHTKQSQDDAAMLREVLTRRFKHSGMLRTSKPSAKEWPLPNLVVIDGGKGQLNAARSVVKDVPIVALTKDERHRGIKIFIVGKKNPISLSKIPVDVKNLFLHIDAEAHRFAIGYYRKLHRKNLKAPQSRAANN